MKVHVCIIDDQPVSSVTPLISEKTRPEAVVLAYVRTAIDKVFRLEKLLKPRGLQVFRWELPDSVLVEEHKMSFLSLIEKYNDSNMFLNASGGARHINLAAYEVFRLYEKPIFYVEPKTDLISWVYPDGIQPEQVEDRLKLAHYFSIFGAEVVNQKDRQGVQKHIRELGLEWLNKSGDYKFAIRTLNYLAGSAMNDEFASAPLDSGQRQDVMLGELIDDLIDIGYCNLEANRLYFTNSEARFFANGGWLEAAVFSLIRKLRKKHRILQDDGQSMEVVQVVKSKNQSVKNELDVVFLANNKLHMIECKTKKFVLGEGNNVLYKLDSLSDILGGLNARAMLVSYLPLSDASKTRAKAMGVKVVDSDSLNGLESQLSAWIAEA